jgi:magnesium transporter
MLQILCSAGTVTIQGYGEASNQQFAHGGHDPPRIGADASPGPGACPIEARDSCHDARVLAHHIFASDIARPPHGSTGASGWVDLFDPSAQELEYVARVFRIQVPSREALQEIETSSRLRADGEVLYLTMPLPERDPSQKFAPVPLGLILSPAMLISVRYRAVRAFETVQAQVGEHPPPGSAEVFTALIEAMVDSSADLLEQLATDLATVSVRTFGHTPHVGAAPRARAMVSQALREGLQAVGSAGDHLSRVRESVLGLQRITRYVEETAAWMSEQYKARLARARQDLASLVDFESHLSGKTQFLLDAVLGFINTEQNDIFKVLTIVSVVGIPPTLIASIYGMNFRHMPELNWPWGYAYGLGLIALSTLLPIIWFKRRGWW